MRFHALIILSLLASACPAEDAAAPVLPHQEPHTLSGVTVTPHAIPTGDVTFTDTVDTGDLPTPPTNNGTDVGADVGQFDPPPGLPPVPHGVLPCTGVYRVGPTETATDFCVFQINAGGSPAACAFTKTVAGGVSLSCWSTFQ